MEVFYAKRWRKNWRESGQKMVNTPFASLQWSIKHRGAFFIFPVEGAALLSTTGKTLRGIWRELSEVRTQVCTIYKIISNETQEVSWKQFLSLFS